MKIKIKKHLAFIAKPNLTEFEINNVNGAYVLTAEKPRFKQLIKASEYAQIMAAQVNPTAVKAQAERSANRRSR